ncbi:hypothetical protein FM111_12965 [Brevundimonas diminuta 3F5N]|uniref:Uncharacterized protein n=1 Tax=Brevundimonas diminuta 3F5N TaxID=1255603 RepID=A0A1R4GHX6_BREDI|nr:hypothetical protein FM111_12965 [Brevundimonas diminuta 3F5N]
MHRGFSQSVQCAGWSCFRPINGAVATPVTKLHRFTGLDVYARLFPD